MPPQPLGPLGPASFRMAFCIGDKHLGGDATPVSHCHADIGGPGPDDGVTRCRPWARARAASSGQQLHPHGNSVLVLDPHRHPPLSWHDNAVHPTPIANETWTSAVLSLRWRRGRLASHGLCDAFHRPPVRIGERCEDRELPAVQRPEQAFVRCIRILDRAALFKRIAECKRVQCYSATVRLASRDVNEEDEG